MRARGQGWIGLLLLVAACQVGAESVRGTFLGTDATVALRACLATLEASGRETLDTATDCTEVARHVRLATEQGLVEGIQGNSRDVDSLRDLVAISESFERSSAAGAAMSLDFAGLDALLDEVLIEEDSENGWWDRFLQWLKGKLPEDSGADFGWLVEWLEDIDVPAWVGDVVYHVSVVTIVVLALFLVASEVRASGILKRRRRSHVAALPAEGGVDSESGPRSFEELAGLAPRQRAAAALALVVRHLAERGWVSARPSLTTGELERELVSHRRALAARFHRLVNAVEIIVYGDRDPDDATERALLADARSIVEDAR